MFEQGERAEMVVISELEEGERVKNVDMTEFQPIEGVEVREWRVVFRHIHRP